MEKAVFLDKDGTLVENIPYNFDPRKVKLMRDVGPGLALLRKAGFRLFVVTNQSGIAQGYGTEKELDAVWKEMNTRLVSWEVKLDGFYYCPHYPGAAISRYADNCACRKPQPGLLLKAIAEHGINPGGSWMVGDILNDVEAGNRAGVRTVLVDAGTETEWHLEGPRTPQFITKNFLDAAERIVEVSSLA